MTGWICKERTENFLLKDIKTYCIDLTQLIFWKRAYHRLFQHVGKFFWNVEAGPSLLLTQLWALLINSSLKISFNLLLLVSKKRCTSRSIVSVIGFFFFLVFDLTSSHFSPVVLLRRSCGLPLRSRHYDTLFGDDINGSSLLLSS